MLVENAHRARSLCYLIAGRRLTLGFPASETPATDILPDAYLPFRCAPDEGIPLFELALGEAIAEPQVEPTHVFGQPAMECRIHRGDAGSYLVSLTDLTTHRTARMQADASWSRLQTTLLPHDGSDARMLDFLLMMAFGFAAPRSGALLMHASVIGLGGKAMLFLGASGTGKSTHAALWLTHVAGATLVNDDNPVVSLTADGGATVSGSPWSGKTPCYRQLTMPVTAFVRLEQAPHNNLCRLGGAHAYAALLPSCADMPWDSALHDATCRLVARLASEVIVARLRCLPDADAARLSHSLTDTYIYKEAGV